LVFNSAFGRSLSLIITCRIIITSEINELNETNDLIDFNNYGDDVTDTN